MRNLTGVCELRITSTARSCDAWVKSISLTARIRSPVLRVPFKPAGLFSSTCFMKMPVINVLLVPKNEDDGVDDDEEVSLNSYNSRKILCRLFFYFFFLKVTF